jgi:hypothetical protein
MRINPTTSRERRQFSGWQIAAKNVVRCVLRLRRGKNYKSAVVAEAAPTILQGRRSDYL